jgi:hypothetical protein
MDQSDELKLILYGLGENRMNKFLSVLVAGLIAGSLSINAFAVDAAKPAVVAASATSTATPAKAAANKAVTNKVAVKKDTGLKASVKKLFAPSAKKTDVKLK